jgi:hypothetical protein
MNNETNPIEIDNNINCFILSLVIQQFSEIQ